MSIVRYLQLIITVSLLFWLAGCERSSQTQAPALEYQQRLAYVMERDVPAADAIRRLSLPERSATHIALEPLQLSLLDAFRLDDCELSSLIADRNSALGRLRIGLRQFHSDRHIAKALQACAFNIAKDNPSLANELTQLSSAKAAQLEALRHNAWIAEPALRNSLRIGANVLQQLDQATFSTQLNSLQRLINAQQLTAPALSDRELEEHLEQLENNNYLAELWRTLLWYEQQLLRANKLVETIADDAGCTPVSVPERAQILRTVFFKFFAADMQAQLGQMIQQATLTNNVLESLEPQLLSQSWRNYLAQLSELPDRVKALTRAHAEQWQVMFEQCRFSPAQSSIES